MCKHPERRMGERGFTLFELVIVAAVVAVLASVSVPTLAGAVENYRFQSSVRSVAGMVQSVRHQAIMRGYPMAIDYEEGTGVLQVFERPAGATEFTAAGAPFPAGRLAFVESGRLVFQPNGRVDAAVGELELTVQEGDRKRTIEVSRFGNVTVQQ